MNKNKNGFTLIEIIVSLLVASIGMLIATSLILNSMGYFSKATVSDHDKQALDGINTYVADELRYASEVKIDVKKPDDTDWNWIYWKDGRLYRNKDQNIANDDMVYNDDFYNNRILTFNVRGFDSYRLDLKFSFEDKNGEIVYKTSNTLELLNLKMIKKQSSGSDPFSNISSELELSGAHSNYKIYYKKGTIPITENNTLSGDGTVKDEKECMDPTVSAIGSGGNNKGIWNQTSLYRDGDFVTHNGNLYRATLGNLTGEKNCPGEVWEWKRIDKEFVEHSNYEYGDIVIFENAYWQVLNPTGSIEKAPNDKDVFAVWGTKGYATVEELIKSTNITPSYFNKCGLTVDPSYKGIVDNKDDNLTYIPDYPGGEQGQEVIFRRYNGAVWLKMDNGAGNIKPGGKSNQGLFVWQKIQIDWDNTSAYVKNDIIRYSGLFYRLKVDEVNRGELPTNSSYWEKVVYKGNGVWEISK